MNSAPDPPRKRLLAQDSLRWQEGRRVEGPEKISPVEEPFSLVPAEF